VWRDDEIITRREKPKKIAPMLRFSVAEGALKQGMSTRNMLG
jgi:hypothetical protein